MKNPPKVKTGDRVRVVLEAEVSQQPEEGYVRLGTDEDVDFLDKAVVSVEVLAPPVEVFGPGDDIRFRTTTGLAGPLLSLGHGGYFNHGTSRWFVGSWNFTSKDYMRVENAR